MPGSCTGRDDFVSFLVWRGIKPGRSVAEVPRTARTYFPPNVVRALAALGALAVLGSLNSVVEAAVRATSRVSAVAATPAVPPKPAVQVIVTPPALPGTGGYAILTWRAPGRTCHLEVSGPDALSMGGLGYGPGHGALPVGCTGARTLEPGRGTEAPRLWDFTLVGPNGTSATAALSQAAGAGWQRRPPGGRSCRVRRPCQALR